MANTKQTLQSLKKAEKMFTMSVETGKASWATTGTIT